jgi:ferredoxin-like protein FixX
LKWVFVKRQCMHCTLMPCADACAPEAFRRHPSGVVIADSEKCLGCSACVDDVYGEKELGGLGWLYLASVPFEQFGLPSRFAAPATSRGMGALPRDRGNVVSRSSNLPEQPPAATG